MKLTSKKIKITILSTLMLLALSGCVASANYTHTAATTSGQSTRYYSKANMAKSTGAGVATISETQAFVEKPQERTQFFGGSFYAIVTNVVPVTLDEQTIQQMGLTQEQLANIQPIYKVDLRGERGTEVSLTTQKVVRVNEEVVFAYNQDTGEIYTSSEPEYQSFTKPKQNPYIE